MKENKKLTKKQKTIVGGIIGAAIVGGIIGACGCKAFMENKYVVFKKNLRFYGWKFDFLNNDKNDPYAILVSGRWTNNDGTKTYKPITSLAVDSVDEMKDMMKHLDNWIEKCKTE